MLVYSGLFLAENTGLVRLLADKAQDGVRVRILLRRPRRRRRSPSTATTSASATPWPPACATRWCSSSRSGSIDGAEIRLHRTVLYNSIYRADDQLLVNTHVYGEPAHNAPVLHLRRVAGGDMVTTYLASFDKVWAAATPLA